MNPIRQTLIAATAAALIGIGSVASAQQPVREITNIAGDLYRYQSDVHYSVFLVTDEGIIATDPMDTEAAEWLKAELARRFDQEVKYLIYSHDHFDHIGGGEVFTDSAAVVSHAAAKADILRQRLPTAVPNITFEDALTLELGGKTVELTYLGKNHSDASIVVNFVDERTIYAVDFIFIKMIAFASLPDAYIDDWLEALRAVEAMDFDIIAPGHGVLGDKSDVTAFREYMEDLHGQVLATVLDGKSAEEALAIVDLSKYSDREGYDAWAEQNVTAMHQRLLLQVHPSNLRVTSERGGN